MSRTTIVLCVPLFAATLLAQGRGPGFGFGPEILGVGPGRAVVTGAPYSGTETTTRQQTLANGNTIANTGTISVARDNSGRIATSQTVTPPAASGKSPYTITTIFDPVAGYSYRLNSATLIAVQTPLPKPRSGGSGTHTPPANPNAATTSLGTMSVNGVNATGTLVTVTIPAGTMGNAQAITSTRTTWVSTTLQIPVEIKTSNPLFGNSDMELTNIAQTEPAASVFAVPSNYTIQQGNGRGPGGRGRAPGANNFRRGGAPTQ